MKFPFKLTALAFTSVLGACQTTAPTHVPPPVDPIPPTVGSEMRGAPATAPAIAPRPRSSAVITLHLAQQQEEPTLIAVDAGGAAPLYALPRPVLTQGDMARVSPVTTQDQKSHLLVEMNQQGTQKLRSITEQAKGHFLLLSVQGQLVSVARIGEAISDGRLFISTQNPQHTQAIIRLMQGER